ncbi:MAG: hypothetical protein R3202_09810 [Candidatus Competibacterales bacterium]|nr:hypothetical protein [Candidatus Competibacterales bacterium]
MRRRSVLGDVRNACWDGPAGFEFRGRRAPSRTRVRSFQRSMFVTLASNDPR